MILIAFISLVGCFFIKNQPTAKWEMISPKGLNGYIEDPKDPRYPGYPDYVVPFFVSDSLGFLVGSTETTKPMKEYPNQLESKAIVYRTIDGGYNWEKHEFGNESWSTGAIFKQNNSIYLIIDYILEDYRKQQLYKFNTSKGDWMFDANLKTLGSNSNTILYNFDNRNPLQPSEDFIVLDYEEKIFFKTHNLQSNWEKHKFPFESGSINPESIYWGEKECWFTSWKGKQSFLGHLDFEKNTGGLEELNFSGEVVALSPTGKIWIAGKEDKDAVLYERESKGKYNLVKRVNYGGGGFYLSSDFLNVNNDEQIWVYSDVKFFPENHFMSSQDGGKTWTEENMPYSAIFDNPYFLYDKKQHKTLVWVNVGGGRLMMRK